uniref:StrN n=1 Tax=Streptomyces glaucescens TaxID=1907 RepID=Q54263_STRGA|nr:StrN [Streptomyces glaucescens]CAA55576.1 strN [Streptomyces glaucescens]
MLAFGMLLENELVDRRNLVRLVAEKFRDVVPIDETTHRLEFFPLGEDSWSYRYGPLWISVRRDLDGHFPGAYEAALLLRRAGKHFVLAPLAAGDGGVVHDLSGLPVVVFPYVERATARRVPPTPAQLDLLVARLTEVHGFATPGGLPAEVPVEDFGFPFEGDLEKALRTALEGDTDHLGPYGSRLTRLVTGCRDRVAELRREAARVAAECAARWEGEPPALTHGDPSPANVLFGDGVDILDWGSTMWAPPERDWAAVARAFGTAPDGRGLFLRFYELRWQLAEIAEYTARFAAPHTGDADDHAMWGRLLRYLPAG